MAASRRKVPLTTEEQVEKAERRRMFVEYREENSRDMTREASGEW